jgi:hypothetical protein
MKAKELRFGNFVRTTITHTNIKITIDELLEIINEPSEHQLEPIPLTAEWLLKFGITESGYNSEDKAMYSLDDREVFIVQNTVTKRYYLDEYELEIKHVHQLQNLYFALTGEELEEQP